MKDGKTGQYDEAVLQIATVLVRIVMIVSWVSVIAITALIVGSQIWQSDVLAEVTKSGFPGSPGATLAALVTIAAGGATMLLLAIFFLRRLLQLMSTVQLGDPFVPENVVRLRAMAWLLLAMEVLGLALGAFSKWSLARSNGFEFSVTGLIAVLSLFVLARVFARGTAMRDDIEGTV